MRILSEQKSKALAEKNGWSLDFAEGFLKGQYSRICNAKLSSYGMVGLDDYCLGFRAGYFARQNPAAPCAEVPAMAQRAARSVRGAAVAASSAATTFKQAFSF